MRVTFHTDRIKSVLLFVHRLTATERASIETVITGQDLTVYLTLVRTTVEDLKRFMRSVPEGEAMAESVQEVTEQPGTELDDTQIGHEVVLDDTRTGYRITLQENAPRPLLYDGLAGMPDAEHGSAEDPVDPKMKADAMPAMRPPPNITPDFKPGDHGWFWGKRWRVTAVRTDARCAFVVDLEREEIPAGPGVVACGGKEMEIHMPATMGRRLNVPQLAVGLDNHGTRLLLIGRSEIHGWLGWKEDVFPTKVPPMDADERDERG